jgi:Flp pilus assembly protein TadG
MALLRPLTSDQRGAAVIETAFLAPILAAMVIGMVQLGMGFSTKLQLEQASQRAIEKVMNGQADTTTISALKTEAATVAGVPEANVTVDFWLECSPDGGVTWTRQASYAAVCASAADYRRYLSVAITKSYSPMFANKFTGANSDGSYTIKGTTSVRTQ